MNIALVGYGKMGQAIEAIALKRGHQIVLKISNYNRSELVAANLQKADIAIEFTHPEAAPGNVITILKAGVPVVCGTTGWNDLVPGAQKIALETGGALLQSSNFSIGVNIFFEINKVLASLMNGHTEYDVTVEETHHTQKKDAPSGTAITIAQQILERLERKNNWVLQGNDMEETDLKMIAHRRHNVPGTHIVSYTSEIDTIDIVHTAHSRDGFALGAVLAAEFLDGKKGIFTMQDVLGM